MLLCPVSRDPCTHLLHFVVEQNALHLPVEAISESSSTARSLKARFGMLLLHRYMELLGDEKVWAVEAPCCSHGHKAWFMICSETTKYTRQANSCVSARIMLSAGVHDAVWLCAG